MEPRSLTAPPRAAAWLLHHALAPSERDAVIGDLHEEFVCFVVPARGLRRGRWWYRWQVARSLAPLFFRSWERASLARATAAVAGAAAAALLPAWLLMLLRAFVLQQVPLKTTAEPSLAFALLLAAVVLSAGAFGLAAGIRLLAADPRDR